MQPIVKQPIHDSKGNVWAYEILYSHNSQWSEKATDADAAAALEAMMTQCSSDEFRDEKTAFVTFTENLLMRNVPSMFATDALVIQLDQEFLLSSSAMNMLSSYHTQGYRIALVGFDFNALYMSAMPMIDYVKLSFRDSASAHSLESAVKVLTKLGKTVIAQHVNSEDSYRAAKAMDIPYMQGVYIAAAMPADIRKLDHLPSNFFELMVAILREEPDINEVEAIIARDVTLTYSLLKLVNSAFFSLRTKVQSVHQALVVLGIGQMKQWIYLLSFKNDGNVPVDFIKTSLMRANFCQALQPLVPDIPISASEAYLMGMFSTLGALLQRPLEETLQDLSIADEAKIALTTQEGKCGLLYKLVLCYEAADWHKISEYAAELNMPANVISQKYFECTDMVNDLWKRLTLDT